MQKGKNGVAVKVKKKVISVRQLCLIAQYSFPMVLRCTAFIGQLENIYFIFMSVRQSRA